MVFTVPYDFQNVAALSSVHCNAVAEVEDTQLSRVLPGTLTTDLLPTSAPLLVVPGHGFGLLPLIVLIVCVCLSVRVFRRLDPWCSGLPLKDVDVSATSC